MLNKFQILVLNGPNINLLGTREKKIYGNIFLPDIIKKLNALSNRLNVNLSHLQSNAEHIIIEKIHEAKEKNIDYILINPAAYTHTSIAIRDSLLSVEIPFIEIHISNIYSRENFRHHSYFSDIAVGVICGFGINSYLFALQIAIKNLLYDKKNY